MNYRVLSCEWLSSDALPDETLLRELLSFDCQCSKSVQFVRDPNRQLQFLLPPSTMHWSRVWEWPWAIAAVPLQDKIVLNAGGGHSVMTCSLAKRAKEVVIADIDDDSLRHVETQRPFTDFPNVRTFRWDLTDLRFATEGLYDAVFCISVLEHVPDWRKALSEMIRVLKPGGKLVLTADCEIVPDPDHRGPLQTCQHWHLVGMGAELAPLLNWPSGGQGGMIGLVDGKLYAILAAVVEKRA